MPEPITLTLLGGVALVEGIKFLYAQAGQLLSKSRDVKAETSEANSNAGPQLASVKETPHEPHQTPTPAILHMIDDLRSELHPYATAEKAITTADTSALAAAEALRRLLEAVYAKDLTFEPEVNRRTPSSHARVDIVAEDVSGTVTGIRARRVRSSDITSDIKVNNVNKGGEVTGIDVEDLSP